MADTDDGVDDMVKRFWRRRDEAGRGLLERSMFSFMGPPQLGENRVREGYVPDAAANLCPKCSRPWDDHERVHTGSMTYRVCPPVAG